MLCGLKNLGTFNDMQTGLQPGYFSFSSPLFDSCLPYAGIGRTVLESIPIFSQVYKEFYKACLSHSSSCLSFTTTALMACIHSPSEGHRHASILSCTSPPQAPVHVIPSACNPLHVKQPGWIFYSFPIFSDFGRVSLSVLLLCIVWSAEKAWVSVVLNWRAGIDLVTIKSLNKI